MPATADKTKTIPALTLTATADITVAAAADGQSAPLPRFKMVAYTGGAMRVAGWRHPVVIDLAGLAVPSQARPIRFGHDPLSGVGHTDSIRVEAGQLVATGVISRDTSAAKEVVASSRNGFPWQASVGASVEEFEFIKDNQKATVNGQELTGPVNVVRKATLGEISFVDLGADGRTSASIAARQNKEPSVMADDPTTSNPTPSSIIATEQTPEQVRAAALAETARIAAVRKVCGGKHSEIEAQAIRDNWDATRTELEVLRASRPKAPAIHAPDSSVTSEVLEAACFQSAKLEGIEKVCSTQAIEIAAKRFQGGLGLQELLFEAAIANGYTGRTFRDSRRVLEAAFGRGIEAGMTTIDVGGILSNVANKFLLEGFFSVERVWRSICAVRNVSDFKTVTSYRLVGKDQYEQVAPGGELKQGTLGEETYTNKADTYGLMLSIDRPPHATSSTTTSARSPRCPASSAVAGGSGLKINDVFWTAFMNNAAFFSVGGGNKNFVSGADSALGIDGLTKGEVAFMDLVDSDGKPTGVMPAILLVPTALSAMGTQLYKSVELRDTTANTKFPVANPHQGKFRIEVSRYLSNALYTGNSAKAWYLLADPSDLPVIEMAFLNGQEAPTVETSDADFNMLGIRMRGYHDFGVNLQDPRGGVKSKGEV